MSITIKLHVDGKAYTVLDYRMSFYQQKDITGKPTGRIHGGLIHVTIEAMMDTIFHHWAVAPEMMKDVEIVFSPVTRVSQSRTIKLYDVFLAGISSHFTNQTSEPMKFTLVLSPGIFVDKDVVHKKPWHVTNLDNAVAEATPDPGLLPEPQVLKVWYEDKSGKEIPDGKIMVGQELYVVVQTSNAKNKTVVLDLDNNKKDFEYNNEVLNDDLLEITIKTDIQKTLLKVIAPQND